MNAKTAMIDAYGAIMRGEPEDASHILFEAIQKMGGLHYSIDPKQAAHIHMKQAQIPLHYTYSEVDFESIAHDYEDDDGNYGPGGGSRGRGRAAGRPRGGGRGRGPGMRRR